MFWIFELKDDDLAVRIKENNLRILRPPARYARFKMIRHKAQELNPNAVKYLSNAKNRRTRDGVNSVKYQIEKISLYTGFTHVLVNIGNMNEWITLRAYFLFVVLGNLLHEPCSTLNRLWFYFSKQ